MERLSFPQPVSGLQQLCEVVDVNTNTGMFCPGTFFSNGQRAAVERLGFPHAIGDIQQLPEIV